MKITKLVCSAGKTGFFFDDQKAIKAGAKMDGNAYFGDPVTPGFTSVRQAGESISVMLVLEDGQVAFGDCAAVQYSGAGGRDPLFLAKDFIPIIERDIAPMLVGIIWRETFVPVGAAPLDIPALARQHVETWLGGMSAGAAG